MTTSLLLLTVVSAHAMINHKQSWVIKGLFLLNSFDKTNAMCGVSLFLAQFTRGIPRGIPRGSYRYA